MALSKGFELATLGSGLDVNQSTGEVVTISMDTDVVSEGTTNLYFTNERVDDRVANLLVGGSNITVTYDDAAGTLTITGQSGYSDSDVDTHLNVSGASANQVLAWSGTDYIWANNPEPTGDSNRVVYDLADPTNTIVLDPGSTSGTATYKGDVLKPDGTVIVDVSSTSTTFTGGLMGNTYGDVYNPTGADKILESGTGNLDSALTVDTITTSSNVIIGGNLTVNGTTTTLNTATLDVEDLNITIANGAADSAAANGAGLTVDGAGANITYTHATTSWDFNKPVNVTGNIGVTGTVDGVDIAARDAILTSTTTTANAALPLTGGTMTGTLTYNTLNDGTTALTSTATELNYLDGTTLTANEIAVADGTGSFITTSNLISIDTSNNRVGINTSSPRALLDISSSTIGETRLFFTQSDNSTDAPNLRIEKSRGSIGSEAAVQNGDGLYRQNTFAHDGTNYLNVGQLEYEVNGSVSTGDVPTRFAISTRNNSTSSMTQRIQVTGDTGVITFNDAYSFPTSDGTANQVLQTDGNGELTFASVSTSAIDNVVEDTTPQLGGNLDGQAFNITTTGDIQATDLIATGTVNLDRLALTSSQTTVSPLQLTANSLQDGVGALRIDGSQADIYLNPSTATHTTVTFAVNNDQRLAFGMDSNSDFYITRRTGGAWYDDTFVIDRDTGELRYGYDVTVAGTLTYTTLNDGTTALTSTVAELNHLDGTTGITLSNAGDLLIVGTDGTSIDSSDLLNIDTSNGRLGIGTSTPVRTLHLVGDTQYEGSMRIDQYHNSIDGPDVLLHKARGTPASPLANQAGDEIGKFNFVTHDGSGFIGRAKIQSIATVDGAQHGANLEFLTGKNAASSVRMTIDELGDTTFTGDVTTTGIDVTGNITTTGTIDGRDVAADGTKLDNIEANATADQTAAQIKVAYESNSDTNEFSDAEQTKLSNIEASATADQTKADIEGLGIDVPATNLTGTIPAARLSTATTQAESDDSTKIATTAYVVDKITTLIGGAPSTLNDLNELAAAINDDASYNTTLTTALGTKLPKSGGAMTGAITTNSTFDGRDVATDGTKLDGIEQNATSDQTAAQIRNKVDAATDSNVFTDADHTKLNGIETNATADQTAAQILTAVKTVGGSSSGLDADLLDGQHGSYYQKKTTVQDAVPSGATGEFWYESDTSVLHLYYGGAWVDVAPGLQTSDNLRINSLGVGTAASGTAGEIRATNDVTAYYSDARLKNFESTIDNALDKVKQLNGYYFTENETAKELGYANDKRQVGVSAQEVEAVLPEIVTEAPISDEYLTVKYEKLAPLFIEAIKEIDEKYQAKQDEQQAQIDMLMEEIAKLKGN